MRPTHASSPHAPSLAPQDAPLFAVSLNAVIVAATPEEPRILVLRTEQGRLEALPAGPLTPNHRTLEAGLRAWVGQQTEQHLGYVEQLYTFGDRSRTETDGTVAPQGTSSHFGLLGCGGVGWLGWGRLRRCSAERARWRPSEGQGFQELGPGGEHNIGAQGLQVVEEAGSGSKRLAGVPPSA